MRTAMWYFLQPGTQQAVRMITELISTLPQTEKSLFVEQQITEAQLIAMTRSCSTL